VLDRRELLAASAAATAGILDPVRALAQAVKPVRITGVDVFAIHIPIPKEEAAAGRMDRYVVCRVETDAGVRGYSFAGPSPEALPKIRAALVGKDLFNIEGHLRNGLLDWGGLEHGLWDAIGKIAGRPVYRLLGGAKNSVKVYLTTVWHGKEDQSGVTYDQQAEMALKEKNAGFKGMKIRAWRPNPLDDAEACRVIRSAVGPDFAIMFDRTAHAPQSVGQKVWDFETGLKVARALQQHGAYWLEEPYARDDYESHARLTARWTSSSPVERDTGGWSPTTRRCWPEPTTWFSRTAPAPVESFFAARLPRLPKPTTSPASFTEPWGCGLPAGCKRPPPLERSGRNWSSSDRLSSRKRCGARACRC
jgi:hypothetical protein